MFGETPGIIEYMRGKGLHQKIVEGIIIIIIIRNLCKIRCNIPMEKS